METTVSRPPRKPKSPLIFSILIVWGIIGLVYIITDIKGQLDNLELARQQGAQTGITQLVSQAMQLSENCEIVPLVFGEKQVNLISTDCLDNQNQVAPIPQDTETLTE